MSAQSQNIEPYFILKEVKWFGSFCSDVQSGARFQENGNVIGINLLGCLKHFEAHHENEGDFVPFEQSSVHISVEMEGQELYDVLHSLNGQRCLFRQVDRLVEQFQELFQ